MRKMKNGTFNSILIIVAVLVLSGFFVSKVMQENKHLRNSMPYLLKGEEVGDFNLIDTDAREIDKSALSQEKPSLIFIFSRPCSPCNKNIVYWKKMAQVLEGRVNIYGVILNNITDAINSMEKAQLNFPIYVPTNLEKFISANRLKLRTSQTIIYTDKVEYLSMEEMEGEDVVKLIETIKKLTAGTTTVHTKP